MMAMLWAQQIMLGKKTYAQVPRLLKDKVKEVLIDSGLEELVTEEQQYGQYRICKIRFQIRTHAGGYGSMITVRRSESQVRSFHRHYL